MYQRTDFEDFWQEQMQSHVYGRGVIYGLLLHAICVIWQMMTVLWPDYPAYFQSPANVRGCCVCV